MFFCMANELLGYDNLHLFLISEGTRSDSNEYLKA